MQNDTQLAVNAAYIRTTTGKIRDLPEWFDQYRPQQAEAVNAVIDAYRRGVSMVVLDAPTGAGKTLIAESVRRVLGTRASYICNTKTLQQQFATDFPYAAMLQGRSNYPTWDEDMPVTADDCNWTADTPCWWCPAKQLCPYEIAKAAALKADLAVVNTSYFLTECNGPGRFSGRGLAIVDEADTLENIVMSYVGLSIGKSRVERLKLGEPTRVTKEEAWLEWIDESIRTVAKQIPVIDPSDKDVAKLREVEYLMRLRGSLQQVRKEMEQGGWIYTGKEGRVEFKPVRVVSTTPQKMWRHAEKFLLMSATIISPSAELEWNGWNKPYEVVSMGSSFPVENRRVKVMPLADMGKKAYEVEKLCAAIASILERHPDERVLIHTVSYELARHVSLAVKKAGRKVVTYDSSAKRDSALASFKRSRGGVLVAASMDRGIDLPDDLCRVVVVAKIPFPFLGDRQVSARLHSPGGDTWYRVQTIRTLVQMCGRATRHANDWSVTYVLDKQWERVWSQGRTLFPKWFVEALDWRDRVRVSV